MRAAARESADDEECVGEGEERERDPEVEEKMAIEREAVARRFDGQMPEAERHPSEQGKLARDPGEARGNRLRGGHEAIVVCSLGQAFPRACIAHDVEEELVDAAIVGEFGMKGGGKDAAGADEDGIVVAAREDFDVGAEARDTRRADEDHLHGAAGERGGRVEDDGVVLAPVGVALDGDVEHAEAALRWVGDFPGEEDAAGAGAEDGLGADEVVEDGVEAGALEVFEEGGGLAAGDDEGVEFPLAFG